MSKGAILGFAFLVVAPIAARAQDISGIASSDSLREVQLSDGSTLYGRVVEVTGDRVVVVTEAGARVELSRSQIASVRPFRGALREGEAWPEDANVSRLFFGPTGRTLPRGRASFGVYELVFPFLSYGITDRITISAGTPVAPGIIGEVFYFAPKVGLVAREKVSVAAGVLAFWTPQDPDDSLGIVYGATTLGGPDRALTLGAGWPFIVGTEDEIADRPVFMVGGDLRVARHIKLITENYVFSNGGDESGLLGSAGVRFFGDRLSADVGVGSAWTGDTDCCIPIVNFVYTFGGE